MKPLGQQTGGKESERHRSLAHDPRKMNAEVIHQQPLLSSRPPALSRRALSGSARRIPPRGPKERPAPRRPRPARVRGPRAVDTSRCRSVARGQPHSPHSRPHLSPVGAPPPSAAVRCPGWRGRAVAPARPCGAEVGAVAQPARRRKGKGPTGRLRPLAAAHSPRPR